MPMPIQPELRESQMSYLVMNLDQYYANKTISYGDLEEALRAMSDDDLQSVLAYSQSPDFIHIAHTVIAERGGDVPDLPAPAMPSPIPAPAVHQEVVF